MRGSDIRYKPEPWKPIFQRDCAVLSWHRIAAIESTVLELAYILAKRQGPALLGVNVEDFRVLLSVDRQILTSLKRTGPSTYRSTFQHWTESRINDETRQMFQIKTDTLMRHTKLEAVLKEHSQSSKPSDILFVAEFQTKEESHAADSRLAQVWNECLGPRPIPFDPTARSALIADGMKHPELRRHIDAWQKLKADGYPKH